MSADGKGGQTIEDTGPLTKKRMETIDEEVHAKAIEFVDRSVKVSKPFFNRSGKLRQLQSLASRPRMSSKDS